MRYWIATVSALLCGACVHGAVLVDVTALYGTAAFLAVYAVIVMLDKED